MMRFVLNVKNAAEFFNVMFSYIRKVLKYKYRKFLLFLLFFWICLEVVKQSLLVDMLKQENTELNSKLNSLKQEIKTLDDHLGSISVTLRNTRDSFKNEEKKCKEYQGKCHALESRFQRMKESWQCILKQVQTLEKEMYKREDWSMLTQFITTLVQDVGHFFFKYFSEEDGLTVIENCMCLEEHKIKFRNIFLDYDDEERKLTEGIIQSGVEKIAEYLEELRRMNRQNLACSLQNEVGLLKGKLINRPRELVNPKSLQRTGSGRCGDRILMHYNEVIRYCNHLKNEVNKLKNFVVDFQWQIGSLQMAFKEVSEHYKHASIDCCKYQEKLMNAAEHEIIQQEEYALKEKYWLETVHQFQTENFENVEEVQKLSEEVGTLHLELNERDFQLQNLVLSVQTLSSKSTTLEGELQKQEIKVEQLEQQLLQNSLKLQEALGFLDERNNLVFKLNEENHHMQDQIKNLEIKLQTSMTSERQSFAQEVSHLKCNIEQLKRLHEKRIVEAKEPWWWDDGWQM